MRYILALFVAVVVVATGVLTYLHLTAGPAVVLPAPHSLSVAVNGGPLLPGGWSNSADPVFSLRAARGLITGADIEVAPAGVRFSASSMRSIRPVKAQANPLPGHASISLAVHLANGAYHWQARLHNGRGISPWVIYRGLVRVDTTPPTVQHLSSPTDPRPTTLYHTSTVTFAWKGTDLGAGVAGYSYLLDTKPETQAPMDVRSPNATTTLTNVGTGTWYFHVRAEDGAGNWGSTVTFPLHIDVTPPGFQHVSFSQYHFDPHFAPLHMSFTITRAAASAHVGVYDQNSGHLMRFFNVGPLRRGQTISLNWDGTTDKGAVAPDGTYEIYIRATDQYGHTNLVGWRDFTLDRRRIVISLSQQRLWAYDGNTLAITSLVTTGNKALPTPTGTFQVLGFFHPYKFISPWPKSSPYYYAPSMVNYALLFRSGGYFVHDAPWRTAFGPGTNAATGTPGTNYTGTHGCVNVPLDVAKFLYGWAELGTVVQVVP